VAIKVNNKGVSHAKSLIKEGKVDKTSDWSFDAEDGNKILGDGNWNEYAKWFLAIDTEANEETKARYKFPYGKNGKVYRRGVIAAKQRAAQQGYDNIVQVADELLQMIDKEEKTFKLPVQTRTYQIRQSDIDRERRTVALSFSSEEPVERWYGMEILDHSEGAVDLSRLKKIGALLINHDPRDQVGVIEDVYLDQADRKGRAIVRFGRSAKAEEVFQDVLDGIRKNVSVGYLVKEMKFEKHENGKDYYRVTRWVPIEISLVSIPADATVGIGRNLETEVRVIKEEALNLVEKEKQEETRQDNKSFNSL
jgi:HK97 family phage prohead protease